jgi:nicotinamide mononucleotide adenylyltransferase
MKKYLAQAAFKSSSNDVKYSMYIGRWQPWHEGHRWLIDQRLNEGKKVLICIRDVEPDEKNPWTPLEVLQNLTHELLDIIQEGKVKIIIIPDIESINIGRGVGYDVIEHCPPDEIKEISATAIRKQLKTDGKI